MDMCICGDAGLCAYMYACACTRTCVPPSGTPTPGCTMTVSMPVCNLIPPHTPPTQCGHAIVGAGPRLGPPIRHMGCPQPIGQAWGLEAHACMSSVPGGWLSNVWTGHRQRGGGAAVADGGGCGKAKATTSEHSGSERWMGGLTRCPWCGWGGLWLRRLWPGRGGRTGGCGWGGIRWLRDERPTTELNNARACDHCARPNPSLCHVSAHTHVGGQALRGGYARARYNPGK